VSKRPGLSHWRFGLLAGRTLRDHAFDDLGYPIVDVEVIPPFDGSPEDMWVWLIFATPEMAASASEPDTSSILEERARELLAAREYPADALPSLRLRYTSSPEIEAGGGRFYFFR
jgi:hypothetical protein